MKKILLLIIVALSFLNCSKGNSNLISYHYTHSVDEIDLFNRINHYRDSIGVRQVVLTEHISYKCSEHNNYMISHNVVNHDYFSDRADNIESVLGVTKVGEIIAYNYLTNKSVLAAWVNSPCHDTIIHTDYRKIGISIKENAEHRKYYTVIFTD
jgi:hypothetical protein